MYSNFSKRIIPFFLLFVENSLSLMPYALPDFLVIVWLRTGSNPADINRFQSHTREFVPVSVILLRQQRTKTVEQIFHQFKLFLIIKHILVRKVLGFNKISETGRLYSLYFSRKLYKCLSVVLGCFLDQLPSPRGEEIRNRYKVEVRFYLSICMNQ